MIQPDVAVVPGIDGAKMSKSYGNHIPVFATSKKLRKKIMKIKVTDLHGEPIDMSRSAYQAIGKAFLLPLDVIVGLMMYQDKEQRLFNHLSETIVVRE